MQTQTQSPSSINHTPSSSSSSSSPNSPPHSSLTLHSHLASSTNSSSSLQSSSSFQFQFQSPSPSRCIGLNLLVKAIHQVTAGSVVGVPYIQRRIVTRRRRPIHFNNLIISTTIDSRSKSKSKSKLKMKTVRQRRANVTMPSKYRDSVLQPLTPKRRSERSSSIKIIGFDQRNEVRALEIGETYDWL
ncbi:hypothetical protein QVD17_36285 [Tagetes erecta]|uniref:Uncharacterized protein n=1 Tax=Tagetes erecta TaxID=13708 RepID=A0AAD8NIV9_TARER|nr:hypothetical protein QVD17_36285 [Tagetes erecta]